MSEEGVSVSVVAKGKDTAQLGARESMGPQTRVRVLGATRYFSPGVSFQCRLCVAFSVDYV